MIIHEETKGLLFGLLQNWPHLCISYNEILPKIIMRHLRMSGEFNLEKNTCQ